MAATCNKQGLPVAGHYAIPLCFIIKTAGIIVPVKQTFKNNYLKNEKINFQKITQS